MFIPVTQIVPLVSYILPVASKYSKTNYLKVSAKSGTAQKCLCCLLETATLIPDNATDIHGLESNRAKQGRRCGILSKTYSLKGLKQLNLAQTRCQDVFLMVLYLILCLILLAVFILVRHPSLPSQSFKVLGCVTVCSSK